MRSRLHRSAFAVLGLSAAAVACLLPGRDGLDGADGSDGGSALDVVTDGALILPDGAPDATIDSPTGPFCSTLNPKPTLCADFDNADFPAGFDTLDQWGNTTAILDGGTLGEPARSFSGSAGVLTGTMAGTAMLEKKFPAKPKTLRIELDYLPVALDPTERTLLIVHLGADTVQLLVKTGGARIAESSVYPDGGVAYAGGNLSKTFTVGAWVHIKWLITIGTASSSSSFTSGGDAVEFDSLRIHTFSGQPEVALGLGYVSAPSPGWSVRMDNVVVDLQ